MDRLWTDLKFTFRMLRKESRLTAVIVLTLAVGIGANTAIFSVINTLVLRPLPLAEPESLVYIQESNDEFEWMSVSYPNYLDWKEQNGVFEQMTAHRLETFNLTGTGKPERLLANQVSASLFPMLRLEPVLGRSFTEEEDRRGGEPVVILSHGLWKRLFAESPDVLGDRFFLDGESYTVIGVMPRGFLYPLDQPEIELYLPIGLFAGELERRDDHAGIQVYARLKPGVSIDSARADMTTVAARLEQEYPATNSGHSVRMERLQDMRMRSFRPALVLFAAAVALVLLIACANVASLLLARASNRSREISVRAALGAGRGRLVRQLLTESALQSLLGGAAGLLVAQWGVTLISRSIPSSAPPIFRLFEIDGAALAFTFVLSIVTGLVFGLAPALQTSRADLVSSLKEGGRSPSAGAVRHRFQDLLVTAEIAVALLLLVSAALLLRSFVKITGDRPGFNPKGVLTVQISLPEARYPEEAQARAFFDRLAERIRALPGVRHAGMSNPLFGGWQDYFILEGRPPAPRGAERWTEIMIVNCDYFRSMEIPLIKGRHFDDRDREGAPAVAIVDRRFAETYWPGENPIGRKIMRGNDPASGNPWLEVVGVVENVRRYGEFFDVNTRVQLYQPYAQHPGRFANLTVKADSAPEILAAGIRSEVLKIDPDQPVFGIRTMEEHLADRLQPRRISFAALSVFAGVAVLLTAVGVYGLMAYLVSQRTHEIGVRIAMGARGKDVFKLVMGRGLWLTSVGVAAGLLLAFLATPLTSSLLFGVDSRDPVVFTVIPLLLALVALAAGVLPARRAARIAPTEALRQE